jgi:hypothetical protein
VGDADVLEDFGAGLGRPRARRRIAKRGRRPRGCAGVTAELRRRRGDDVGARRVDGERSGRGGAHLF